MVWDFILLNIKVTTSVGFLYSFHWYVCNCIGLCSSPVIVSSIATMFGLSLFLLFKPPSTPSTLKSTGAQSVEWLPFSYKKMFHLWITLWIRTLYGMSAFSQVKIQKKIFRSPTGFHLFLIFNFRMACHVPVTRPK